MNEKKGREGEMKEKKGHSWGGGWRTIIRSNWKWELNEFFFQKI